MNNKSYSKPWSQLLLIVILYTFSATHLFSDQNEKVEIKLNRQHPFEIGDCGVRYNGNLLPMNGNYTLWENALGKNYRLHGSPERYFSLVYDEMGVIVNVEHDKVTSLKIFFMDYEDIAIRKGKVYSYSGLHQALSGNYKEGPRPVYRFNDAILVQNTPLTRGMGIEEILYQRKNILEEYQLSFRQRYKVDEQSIYKGKGVRGIYYTYTKKLCNDKAYLIEYHLGANKQLKKKHYFEDGRVQMDEWEPAIHYISINEMTDDTYDSLGLKPLLSFSGDYAWMKDNKEKALFEYQKHINYMTSVGREREIKEIVFQRVEQIKKDKAAWEKNHPDEKSTGDYKTVEKKITDNEYLQKHKEFIQKIDKFEEQIKNYMRSSKNGGTQDH